MALSSARGGGSRHLMTFTANSVANVMHPSPQPKQGSTLDGETLSAERRQQRLWRSHGVGGRANTWRWTALIAPSGRRDARPGPHAASSRTAASSLRRRQAPIAATSLAPPPPPANLKIAPQSRRD